MYKHVLQVQTGDVNADFEMMKKSKPNVRQLPNKYQ